MQQGLCFKLVIDGFIKGIQKLLLVHYIIAYAYPSHSLKLITLHQGFSPGYKTGIEAGESISLIHVMV